MLNPTQSMYAIYTNMWPIWGGEKRQTLPTWIVWEIVKVIPLRNKPTKRGGSPRKAVHRADWPAWESSQEMGKQRVLEACGLRLLKCRGP